MIHGTSLADEMEELRRWKLRPEMAHMRHFERLAKNEFQSVEEQQSRLENLLSKCLRFAATSTPYYREIYRQSGLAPDAIRQPGGLPQLPVLSKQDVITHGKDLRAESLPVGEGPPVPYASTGTTGQPVQVIMSRFSSAMFGFLWQRQARWFRLDPMGCFAKVRIPSTLPRQRDGSPMPRDVAMRRRSWTHMGGYFETGPEITFSNSSPVKKQIAWLQRYRPDYLLAYPGVFEELALACGSASPVDSLQSLLGIGSSVSPSMRAWIERTYGIPLHQNYGLNEIGIVAIRCAAGRYHVNTEHCLVEIVDSAGHSCPPGASGRLLVTALQNVAMPLIRYDTGDIAMAAGGDCPCGRTLPAFGDIVGRYRRYSGLPAGTRQRVHALLGAIEAMPPELVRQLRRYQIHQSRENHFEVRLSTAGPLPAEFAARIRERWQKVEEGPPLPLSIVEGATISSSPGGKLLDFDSEFYSKADMAARSAIEDRTLNR